MWDLPRVPRELFYSPSIFPSNQGEEKCVFEGILLLSLEVRER
jgi:hypothetical protein